jgi:hypothetical protein
MEEETVGEEGVDFGFVAVGLAVEKFRRCVRESSRKSGRLNLFIVKL